MTKQTYYLKSSVHVNVSLILKIDYVLLQRRSKTFHTRIVLVAIIIHHNIAHKLLSKQTKCFSRAN